MNIVIVAGVIVTVLTCIPVLWQLRGHPRGLFVLFFAEMWERFSFYGLRSIFVLYLTKHFLFDDHFASGQVGAYLTLAYLLPLVGGVLADHYLGTRKAVGFGALLLVAGQLTMAVQGPAAQQVLHYGNASYAFVQAPTPAPRHVELKVGSATYAYGPAPGGGLQIKGLPAAAPLPAVLPAGSFTLSVEKRDPVYVNFMYFALALSIMGVGFLKANISSIVGQLYPQGDPRRDSGFTLYYFGINLGSFWATILCGYLGETVGWWAGFGLAGMGMLAGFIVFVLGRSWLEGKGEPPDPVRLARPVVGPLSREAMIYVGGLAGVGLLYLLVRRNDLVGVLLGIGSVLILGYVGWFILRKASPVERRRLFLALFLIVGSVVFFTLEEQAGTSLSTFADRNIDLSLVSSPVVFPFLGHEVFLGSKAMLDAAPAVADRWWVDMGLRASQTQSFQPGFLLVFAPIFAASWAWLGRRDRDPNPIVKFGLGLLQVGFGFLVLVFGAKFADGAFKAPLFFLGMSYLLQSTGELCLSPVGMSEITKLAPPILVSTLMALWFLSISWAEWIGGLIAQFAGTETIAGQVLDPARALATSTHVFTVIGWAAAGVGVLFLALSPVLKGWGAGVNDAVHTAPEPIAPVPDGDRQAVNLGVLDNDRRGF